jgi:class 3 adenylate cyclase
MIQFTVPPAPSGAGATGPDFLDRLRHLGTPPGCPAEQTDAGGERKATHGPCPELPERFGRYAIRRLLGRGGMGAVYLAHDTHLDRPVALKVPNLGAGDPTSLRERFFREARAAALLRHPGICPVFDVGAVGEVPYLTMAYIEGTPLSEWAATHKPSPAQSAALVRSLALAVAEAHRHGVIHRDLKPSNVLITPAGEPVVTDFGLARRLGGSEARLTQSGVALGTPAYMPPEQVLGDLEAVGPPSDVYSLGALLYELLTGEPPFRGPVTAVLMHVVHQEPAPPSRQHPGLDPRLEAVCLRALAKDPARRFAGMPELAEALADCLRPADPAPSGASAAPVEIAAPDSSVVGKALALLRRWGYKQGLYKLRCKAGNAREPARQTAWQGLVDWLSGERTPAARAVMPFQGLEEGPVLRGWALVGQVSRLLRERDATGAHKQLDRAGEGPAADPTLRATLAHLRGLAWSLQGRFDQALAPLHRALEVLGKDHYATGQVLDSLAAAHAGRGCPGLACELYELAILHKQGCGDRLGLAGSHGRLGRLCLEWGWLEKALGHCQEDLRLARQTGSRWGEAHACLHLGQAARLRGEREAAAGRMAAARRHRAEAAEWIDESLRRFQEAGGDALAEAVAHKEWALRDVEEGDLDSAEEHARRAAALFEAARLDEGPAQVGRVEGRLLRARGKWDEASQKFRSALEHFERAGERHEAAFLQLEIARALRAAGREAARAYLEALERAETCGDHVLAGTIEEELREVDGEAWLRHAYRRQRGHEPEASPPPPGWAEGTVLRLELDGVAAHAQGKDPGSALLALDDLLGLFGEPLRRGPARVLACGGDCVLAVLAGPEHAARAAGVALDLAALVEEVGRPRRLLGLPPLEARVALASGELLLGEAGTAPQRAFTALGPAVEQARRLVRLAGPGRPWVTGSTRDQLGDRFSCEPAPEAAGATWVVLRRDPARGGAGGRG